MHAALGLYLEAGPAWCEQRIRQHTQRLAEGLADLGLPRYGTNDPAHGSGIVTIAPDAPEALFEHLLDHGVTGALRNRKLRLAPSWCTLDANVDAALQAVASSQQHLASA
jgi:selenocysteine lyase/cysteine desulfurase